MLKLKMQSFNKTARFILMRWNYLSYHVITILGYDNDPKVSIKLSTA
jgi:hypothetical protein